MGAIVEAAVHGLETNPNVLSQTEPGGLHQADNTLIAAPGLLGPRPGFAPYGGTFGSAGLTADAVAAFGGGYVVHYALSGSAGVLAASTGGAAFTAYSGSYRDARMGTFVSNVPVLARMRMVGAGQSLYFNTQAGTYVIPDLATQPIVGGVPRPLGITAATDITGFWQDYNTAVAYRSTLVRKDAHGHVIEGAPSQRAVLSNRVLVDAGRISRTGSTVSVLLPPLATLPAVGSTFTLSPGETNFPTGAKTVISAFGGAGGNFQYTEAGAAATSTAAQDIVTQYGSTVTVALPPDATTSHWIRLYRSDETATAADTPSDDMYMVAEQMLTAASISAGSFTITDQQSTDGTGDPLYTSPNASYGALATHQPLPVARDMCFWPSQGRLCWANAKGKARLQIELLGTGTGNGIQAGDTVSVSGLITTRVYTATYGTATAGQFHVPTSGPSSLRIQQSAVNLCAAINADQAASGVVARYVSSDTEFARGLIEFEEVGIGTSVSFAVVSSRGKAFNPELPSSFTGSGSNYLDANLQPNAVWYADTDAPEHVQLTSYFTVGSKSDPIVRCWALLLPLIVFKTDGIYMVTGNAPPFTVSKLSEATLIAADAVASLSDSLYALTDQGVVRVSQSGSVSILSRASIDDQLQPLFGSALLADTKRLAFAQAYESRRLFLLWVPSKPGLSVPDLCFCFNASTQEWTRWTKPANCAVLDETTEQLVLGRADTNGLAIERKALDSTDVCDEDIAVTISVAGGSVVTLAGQNQAQVGDRLRQGSNNQLITGVINNPTTTVLSLLSPETWTTGAATVLPAFPCTIVWNPVTADNPAYNKTWGALSFLFQQCELHNATLTTVSEQQQLPVTQALIFPAPLGAQAFGTGPLGGTQTKVLRISSIGTKTGSQLVIGLAIREAQSRWQLQGLVVEGEVVSEAARR